MALGKTGIDAFMNFDVDAIKRSFESREQLKQKAQERNPQQFGVQQQQRIPDMEEVAPEKGRLLDITV